MESVIESQKLASKSIINWKAIPGLPPGSNKVLNQKDDFYFRKTKCYKGPSPRSYKCLKTVSFTTAL